MKGNIVYLRRLDCRGNWPLECLLGITLCSFSLNSGDIRTKDLYKSYSGGGIHNHGENRGEIVSSLEAGKLGSYSNPAFPQLYGLRTLPSVWDLLYEKGIVLLPKSLGFNNGVYVIVYIQWTAWHGNMVKTEFEGEWREKFGTCQGNELVHILGFWVKEFLLSFFPWNVKKLCQVSLHPYRSLGVWFYLHIEVPVVLPWDNIFTGLWHLLGYEVPVGKEATSYFFIIILKHFSRLGTE